MVSTEHILSVNKVVSAGNVNVGAMVSNKVIFCISVLMFPHSSETIQVRISVPVLLQPLLRSVKSSE